MSILATLKESPAPLPMASKFTSICGAFYMANGALVLVWPGVAQTILRDPDFVGHEAALFRVVGMCLLVIGWLYFFGGRSGGRQFVAATVVDRIVLVPLVLVPTAAAGVLPHTLLMFAVIDPALALVGWFLLARRR